MDNEQLENSLFGLHHGIQQLQQVISKQDADIVDLSNGLNYNFKSLMTMIEGLQNDIIQLRLQISEIKNNALLSPKHYLTPKTPVVLDSNNTNQDKEPVDIKWDKRDPQITPEESFGFKIPNVLPQHKKA